MKKTTTHTHMMSSISKMQLDSKLYYISTNTFRIEAKLKNGHTIGYINVSINEQIALLCDIFIKNDYINRWPKMFPIFKFVKNYRGYGIGSMLLKQAIEEVRKKNCIKFVGIMKGDINKLKSFYSNHGFNISGTSINMQLLPSENA